MASSAAVESVNSELSAEIDKKQDVVDDLIIQRHFSVKFNGKYEVQIPIDIVPGYFVIGVVSASEGFINPTYVNWYITNRQPKSISCFIYGNDAYVSNTTYVRIIVTYMRKEFIGGQL